MKKIFLFSGVMRSGKNQACDFVKEICKEQGLSFSQFSYAEPLKEICKQDFKALADYLNKYVSEKESWCDSNCDLSELRISDDNWYENKTPITRILLQTVGTEIFRKRVDRNYWILKAAENVMKRNEQVICNSDVRFKNEIELFEKLVSDENTKVYKIRINRELPSNDLIHQHESETELKDYYKWDWEINNNGTLDEYKQKVREVINAVL